ncbi:MAG: hypothetical protein P8X70_01835 [Nanoarchaeota archaeon]|jgi:hypothetical protein
MGFIRGVLIVFVCVTLFSTLLIGNLMWTIDMSLEYKNVKAELGNFMNDLVEQSNIEDSIDKNIIIMQTYCQSNPEYVLEEDSSGFDFNIPCDIISQGSAGIINYIKTDFIEKVYYQEYNCNFWDCFEKTNSPLFLVSEKAKNYWHNKFYFALLISLGLVGLSFLLVDKKSNVFFISGILLLVSSLPFVKLDSLLTFLSDKTLLRLLSIFFTESYTIFVVTLSISVILIGIGILFKFFKIGFKISNIFSKLFKKNKAKKVSEDKKTKEDNKKDLDNSKKKSK